MATPHYFLRRTLLALAAGLMTVGAAHAQSAVRVGSKIDTEGKLLGNIVVLALEANGIKTENKVSLGNTKVVRTALLAGEIDLYPEYTGNGAFMLGDEGNKAWKDLRAGYELAKKMDFEKNKIVWLEPANANNTWAIAVRKDIATANKLRTLQDVVVRYERLRGKDALWVVGTDHAGIATQMVVERQLELAQDKRTNYTREDFVAKVWEWKAESGGTITRQLRRLGCSMDWSREQFTMDPHFTKAVVKVFVDLFNQGLIYRDKRLVNWDPKLKTAISDLEVETREMKGGFWHFKYPLADGVRRDDGLDYIEVATTRPETMLADMAVAVHPDDPRYASVVGKDIVLPITGRHIPVVADEHALDCGHAPQDLVRSRERHRRLADVHRVHVDEAADCQRERRERELGIIAALAGHLGPATVYAYVAETVGVGRSAVGLRPLPQPRLDAHRRDAREIADEGADDEVDDEGSGHLVAHGHRRLPDAEVADRTFLQGLLHPPRLHRLAIAEVR